MKEWSILAEQQNHQSTGKVQLLWAHLGPPDMEYSRGSLGICTCYQTSLCDHHAELTGDSFTPRLVTKGGELYRTHT